MDDKKSIFCSVYDRTKIERMSLKSMTLDSLGSCWCIFEGEAKLCFSSANSSNKSDRRCILWMSIQRGRYDIHCAFLDEF